MWLTTLESVGACVVTSALDPIICADLIARLTTEVGRGGNRETAADPLVAEIAWNGPGRKLAQTVLGDAARPVRVIYFDKRPDANWSVPHHQDVTIAVNGRAEVDGYGPWTTKAGITHVQPPACVLEQMAAVRFHLDDCDENNGPLRVLVGTHRLGKLTGPELSLICENHSEQTLTARAGDAVLMRPLTVHASSPAVIPRHRRVLHIEYAAVSLPEPLAWYLTDPETGR